MIQTAKRIAGVDEYYFSKKLAEVRSLGKPGKHVINLGIGSPDMPPDNTTIDALIESAKVPTHHGYQSYRGISELREQLAHFSKETYGISLDPDSEILPLMGSKEGIMHISMAFVNENEEVLVPDPGYPTYSSVSKLVGAKIHTYDLPEESWSIDVEGLRDRDLTKVKIMWINFPHMPTGKKATRDELKVLVDLARENNFLIVNDNPYSLILNDKPTSLLSIEGAKDVAIELNSLSKSHNMAGWRIGWAAGKKEFIDSILKVKSNMDSGMFLGLQHAAVEALKNDQGWFDRLNETYKERKAVVIRILEELKCSFAPEQSGLFVWAKAPDEIENVEKWIDQILYGASVFITPGFIFGKNGKRFIRISLCNPVSELGSALERIKSFQKSQYSNLNTLY